MADRAPRGPTRDEAAPLLRDPEADDTWEEPQELTWQEKVNAILQEPLTPLSKVLLVVAIIFLLLSSIFIGLFAGVRHKLELEKERKDYPPSATTTVTTTTTAGFPRPTENVCITKDCIILSASILSSLDTSQDPCENFFEYAGGGWMKSHPIPGGKSSYGSFALLAEQNKELVREIVESYHVTASFDSPADDEILRKIRDFYSSCTNEDKLDEIGTGPLIDVVQVVRKLYRGNSTKIGATSDEDSEDRKKGLTAALSFLHTRGIGALFAFEIEGDIGRDPNDMTLWFQQPQHGLPSKEYFEEEDVREAYRGVIERLLLTLDEEEVKLLRSGSGSNILVENNQANIWPPWPWPPWGDDDDDDDDGDKDRENRTERAHELSIKVLEFESKLAAASLDLDIFYQDPIATYNPLPFSNLSSAIPEINFPVYFAAYTPRAFPSLVIQSYPSYASSLSKILKETPSDVVESYLIIRAALELSPYLSVNTEAWQAQRALYELLSGIKPGSVQERSKFCLDLVEDHLGLAAGRYFVNATFPGESRAKGTKVITDIIDAFKTSLAKIEWMDDESAKAAAEKADSIRVKVGYPLSPDLRDPQAVARYYSLFKVDKDSFFANMLSSAGSSEYRTWQKLGKRRDMDEFGMPPSMVNAYYNPGGNEIVFPAGILQPPFFSKDWPAYLAYGAFGHVAAHELTHAFDSAGRMFNQQGKLESWWTNETSEGFDRKQECIVKQFSEYSVDDGKGGKVYINGNLTSGENIGDSGLIQAYRAWKKQFSSSFIQGDEFMLPGLDFTREQLFFISFARIWAINMKTAALVQQVRTNPHSPGLYRVQGTLRNIPEFAAAFKCATNTTLNPPMEDRCLFWS